MADNQITLSLDDEDIAELIGIAKIADSLPKIIKEATQTAIDTSLRSFSAKVAKTIGVSSKDVWTALWALTQIYRTGESLKLEPDATIEVITQNILRSATTPERKSDFEIWKVAKNQIRAGLESIGEKHPLILSYKAFRSSMSRPNVIVDMSISTTARPVFSKSETSILVNVISHVLRFECHVGPGHQHSDFYLSLDTEDIARLRQLCNLADKQAKILIKDLSKAPWPSALLMEVGDESSEHTNG
jgi:hypothetical protein